VAPQPLQARGRARGGLANERCERTPRGQAEHDQRLQRIDRVAVVRTVGRERRAHVRFQQAEGRPAVDHAGKVPLSWTGTGVVEVLPDSAGEDISEMGVTVDRLLGQVRRPQARSGIAQDVARLAAHQVGDPQGLGPWVEAPERPAVRPGRVMERPQRRSGLGGRGWVNGTVGPEDDVLPARGVRPGFDQARWRDRALPERSRKADATGEGIDGAYQCARRVTRATTGAGWR